MRALSPWIETPIAAHHDRNRFRCGDEDLDLYFRRHARQNHEKGGAKCFVAVDRAESTRVLGFYTLSPASLAFARTPDVVRRGLGRYDIPVFRFGRLAVDLSVQGRGLGGKLLLAAGLGGKLLLAAGERALRVAEHVGGVALLIDAKHERAAEWYRSYGAHPLLDAKLTLLLPLKTVAQALGAVEGERADKSR